MTTLTNEFHGTKSRTRLTRDEMEKVEHQYMCGTTDERRQARQVIRRHWRKLCGIQGCTCGNTWGER